MKASARLLASLSFCAVAAALAGALATDTITAAIGNPAANLDQCANGPSDAPVPCTGAAWQNGNANASGAHWMEGDSIAYRMRFSNITTGVPHQVTIQWDTTKAGKHALDYLTSYNRTEKVGNDPCSGVAGCGSPSTFPIPPDLNTGLNPPGTPGSPKDGRWDQLFTMFNGTITSVDIADPTILNATVPYNLTGTYAVDSMTSITITFTATSSTPVLAWGAHIATRRDWGSSYSAVAITGSPFHMRLLGLDGAGGNQDRGLASSAVIFPAILTITKNAHDSTGANLFGSTPFTFTATSPLVNGLPEVSSPFTLVNDGVTPPDGSLPANQRQFKLLTFGTAGTVTVKEQPAQGFVLTGLACEVSLDGVPQANPNIVDVATATATIIPAEGQEINCTYLNQQFPTLTVVKNVVKTNGGNADAGAFTIRVTGTGTNLAFSGSSQGTVNALPAGTYTIKEDPASGYTLTSFSGDCVAAPDNASASVTLTFNGGNKTCTITNSDQPGHLTIKKVVNNNNGGTRQVTDFKFRVNGGEATAFVAGGSTVDVPSGTFNVVEDAIPIAGYTTTYNGCSGTIRNGESKTCTITNSDQAAHLIIKKVVVNDNAGTLTSAAFSGTIGGSVVATGGNTWAGASTDRALTAVGSYSIRENAHPGYDVNYSADCDGTINLGETRTCTITNDDQTAHLTLVKVVTNNNGGIAKVTDFTLRASGPTALAGAGGADGNVNTGTYSLSETGPDGYTASAWSCAGGSQTGSSITLKLGESATCTVTNDDKPAHLKLVKTVVNNNGGTAKATDFTLRASGPTPIAGPGGAEGDVSAGSYSLSETGPAGYTASAWSCAGGVQTGSSIALRLGESATCTLTNDDKPAHLKLVKTVVNNNGGAATATDFTLTASGPTPIAGAGGADADVNAGTYSLSETGPDGYDASAWSCAGGAQAGSSIVLKLGESAVCTIINDDQPPRLIINVVVINDNGGSLTPAGVSGSVSGVTATGGQTWTGASTTMTLTSIGSYTVTPNAYPGYDTVLSGQCTGPIALGDTRTCTVTLDDQPAQLVVKKVVVNNNGGALTAAAFSGTIGGEVVAAAGNTWVGAATTLTLKTVGSYSVAENAHPGYSATFSAECSGRIGLGETRTCIVTNDDQPARLTLIKHVDNGNGGSATAAAFTLTAFGSAIPGGARSVPGTEAPGVTIEVNAGSYVVTESSVVGYRQVSAVGCEGILVNGASATCTITNDDSKARPTAATTMSWVLHDSLVVTGMRPGASGATVKFKLYGPDDATCSGNVINGNGSGEVRPVVNGTASTSAGYSLAEAQLPNRKGTFRWIAEYSGDNNNNPATTKCGDETHTITVIPPPVQLVAWFITPVDGATSVDTSQPIEWTAVADAQAYYLYIGTSRGAKDLVDSGELQQTWYQAYGLPANQLLYARLWTKKANVWRYSDIAFTAATGGPTLKATVITPANGATGVDPNGVIQWTPVANAQKYYVYVGSTQGAQDLIDSQEICDGCINSPMATSWSLANAGKPPAQGLAGKAGQKVYLRMWTMVGGMWRYVDSSFTLAQ